MGFGRYLMSLLKICSRTLTKRILQQHGAAAPVYFSISRNMSFKDTQKNYRDKKNEIMDKVAELSQKLPRPATEDDVQEASEKRPATFAYDESLITKEADHFLEQDLGNTFQKGYLTPASEEEHQRHGKKAFKIEFEGSDETNDESSGQTISDEEIAELSYEALQEHQAQEVSHSESPYFEKGKAADPGESFGPAKAEFDSWKRIYKEEEIFERLGLPPRAHYWRDGELYTPFGTLSNPVKVYSQFSHRIVGCRGGNGKAHEIVWINLGTKYKTMCPECGQMFMLVNYRPEEAEEAEEDLDSIREVKDDGQLVEPQLY